MSRPSVEEGVEAQCEASVGAGEWEEKWVLILACAPTNVYISKIKQPYYLHNIAMCAPPEIC